MESLGRRAFRGIALHIYHTGGTFGGQYVVQGVVRIIADSDVIIAFAEDIALCVCIIIAGQQILVAYDCQRFGSAGLQQGSLAVIQKLDSGFFHLVFLLIFAIGRLGIHLHHALAGHAAGVRNGDCHRHSFIFHRHAVQLLIEGGIAQAITEGIGNLLGIVPCTAINGACGTGGIEPPQHLVLIPGFVILITDIDSLGLHGVIGNFGSVGGGFLQRFCQVGPLLVVEGIIDHGWGGQGTDRIGVHQLAGGIGVANQDVRHADEAFFTRTANPQHSVHVVLLDPVYLHGVACIKQHNGFLERAGIPNHGQQIFFILAQRQLTDAFRGGLGVELYAFAALPCQHHDSYVVKAGCPGGFHIVSVETDGFLTQRP